MTYGLALGGGAARGLVHIGVWQYLEEQGMIPSEVAGTSMGAVVGACIACGMSSQEMMQLARDWNQIKFRQIDPGFTNGFIKGDALHSKFVDIFKDGLIEDCPIKLTITATDIDSGQLVLFSKGKIADAVRASISLPGIMEPFVYGEAHLIDGGVLCNLPVDILETKRCIAVSAFGGIRSGKIEYKKHRRNLRPSKSLFGLNYGLLAKTTSLLIKENEAKSVTLAKEAGKLVTLISPKHSYTTLDFAKYQELVKIGYEAMSQASTIFGSDA